jgi:1-hydroxycarotenoid 3,4-desaturase
MTDRVVIVGAGIAGLAAALDLSTSGREVLVLERAATPGGKLRQIVIDGRPIDAGPTVFTMKRVFEELFADAGTSLEAQLTLRPTEILARHAWSATERLDLFADVARSTEAIGTFAGRAAAHGFRQFTLRARKMFETLEPSFIRNPRPTPISMVTTAGPLRMLQVSPFASLWSSLGQHFRDPRLRQLFARYSTYSGASPFQCPATLMLIAHVEQDGVWMVDGGMHRVAQAIAALATSKGAEFRYNTHVAGILTSGGRASGVRLESGEEIAASQVIVNADLGALSGGLFGPEIARAVPRANPVGRSLSALTWTMLAEARGFPLSRHTVFFGNAYESEFNDIFRHQRLPRVPTVYVCAQDRDDSGLGAAGPERLLCLVNAPAIGDRRRFEPSEIDPCETSAFQLLERCGLTLDRTPANTVVTTPAEWNALFPATGGALYGPALHSWNSSFQRPPAKLGLPGLFLAGGSAHPGPGVPMATLSGRMAAHAAMLARPSGSSRPTSPSPSRLAATPGGTWMR